MPSWTSMRSRRSSTRSRVVIDVKRPVRTSPTPPEIRGRAPGHHAGPQLMTADRVRFARSRHDANDYSRAQRQQLSSPRSGRAWPKATFIRGLPGSSTASGRGPDELRSRQHPAAGADSVGIAATPSGARCCTRAAARTLTELHHHECADGSSSCPIARRSATRRALFYDPQQIRGAHRSRFERRARTGSRRASGPPD